MSASATIRAILCIVEKIPDALEEEDQGVTLTDLAALEDRLARVCIAVGGIRQRRLNEQAARRRADLHHPQGPEDAA
jgi:hypothetical protein